MGRRVNRGDHRGAYLGHGCDYLDAVRDDRVWSRTKKVAREAVGDTTLSTIKQAASMVAVQLIKANLGA